MPPPTITTSATLMGFLSAPSRALASPGGGALTVLATSRNGSVHARVRRRRRHRDQHLRALADRPARLRGRRPLPRRQRPRRWRHLTRDGRVARPRRGGRARVRRGPDYLRPAVRPDRALG